MKRRGDRQIDPFQFVAVSIAARKDFERLQKMLGYFKILLAASAFKYRPHVVFQTARCSGHDFSFLKWLASGR
jgi:hypothetical protein